MISKDINSHIDINNLDDSIKIYGCMQLKPNGKFYFDWEKKTLQKKFNKDTGTGNSHNDYVEDVFAMRFYITKQDINFKIGDEVGENTFSGNVSIFELRRNENDNIVLWHLKDKEKNEWEAVDGEVIYYSLPHFMKNVFTEQITYHCTTQSENDISKSYTVKIFDDDQKIGKNTVETNSTKVVDKMSVPTKSKKTKKSYTEARVGIVALGISFVISLILAWQVSIYILIVSAILLAIFIICLISLKKSGFECTKIFCFCIDTEENPEKEISINNGLINPKLKITETHIK